MRRENGKASARRLVLVRGAERPESNGPSAKLREPALQLGLRRVMRKTAHVEDLAALRQEGANICPGIHWAGEDVRVLVRWLRLADKTPKDASKGDRLFHSPPRRRGGQCLQVEREVVLNRSGRLDRLDLEGGADVGQSARTEGQRLWVVGLPALIFRAQVECPGVLEVGRQHDSFVPSLAWQLHTQIPRVECDEGEFVVLGEKVFVGELVEAVDCVTERTGVADVLPGEGGQRSCGEQVGQRGRA